MTPHAISLTEPETSDRLVGRQRADRGGAGCGGRVSGLAGSGSAGCGCPLGLGGFGECCGFDIVECGYE